MATVYSGWSDTWRPSGSSVDKKYRARIDYSTSYNDTTFYCTVTVYVNLNSSVEVETINGRSWATDYGTATGTTSTAFGGATTKVIVSSRTYSWSRGTSARTVYVYGSVMSNKKDWDGYWMTASAAITIPARASWAVTYNSNVPSGESGTVENMPTNQTKYHSINLVLSSNTPTLENWVFTGWNTAADGSGTAYAKGATYTGNAALTLYAQWAKVYVAPIVGDVILTRVETSSGTTPYDEGDYLCVSIRDYTSGDVPADGASRYKQTTVTLAIEVGGSTYTLSPLDSNAFTGLGAVKNIHYHIPTSGYSPSYPTSDSYTVTLTFTTTDHGSVVYSTTLTSSVYPIDVAEDASTIAFGIPTRVKQDLFIDIDENAEVGTVDEQIYTALVELGWWDDVQA